MKVPFWLVVIFLLVHTICVTGCKPQPVQNTLSDEAVERDIRAHLPIGSSTTNVLAYLDERQIRHDWLKMGVRLPGDSTSIDPDTGLPAPNVPILEAVITNAQRDPLLGGVDIAIDFEFDATKSKLVKFTIQDVFTYK